jgi:hypothetical protein
LDGHDEADEGVGPQNNGERQFGAPDIPAASRPRRPLDDRFHETGIDEPSIHGTRGVLADSSFENG